MNHNTNPPPHRHLGHAIFDLLFYPLSRLPPARLPSLLTARLIRTSWTQRAIVIVLFAFFALAEYQLPGHFPTAHQLAVGATSLLSSAAVAVALLALDDWLEDAIWPWQQHGWVWPWERWIWARAVGSSYDPNEMTSFAETTPLGASACLRPNDVDADAVFASPEPAHQGSFIIPPTPLLPRSMRPEKGLEHIVRSTPPTLHHSGLLGASPDTSGAWFAGSLGVEAVGEDWAELEVLDSGTVEAWRAIAACEMGVEVGEWEEGDEGEEEEEEEEEEGEEGESSQRSLLFAT